MGQVQPLPRARNADVAEPALLLHALLVVPAAHGREEVFLHAHHEHVRELEALCAVQRHHRHRAAVLVHRIQIGHQRDVLQILRQRGIVSLLLKLLHRTDKLADVLHAAAVLVVVLLGVLALQARRVDDVLHQLGQLHGLRHHRQAHHQLAELLHALSPAGIDGLRNVHAGGQKRHLLLGGVACQLRHRRIADGALGHVDDAAHGDVVRRVDHHAQIGQDVLDLLAVVEPQSAIHAVFDAALHERLFNHAGLRVRAVEHGRARIVLALHLQRANLLADPGRLLALVARAVEPDHLARALLGPQRLVLAVLVERDHLIGRVQDVGRGAVVLLELDDLRIRKVLFKVQNVADIRAAPAVDRLIVVADDAEVAALLCQQAHEHILRVVGILILVHVDIAELALIRLQHRRMRGKQLQRLDDQVVKVERVGALELLLVSRIHVLHHLAAVVPVGLGEPLLRSQQLVLRVGDLALDLARRKELLIDIQALEDFLERAHLVVVVVDRERARIAQLLDVPAEDFGAAGVERGHPHVRGGRADQLLDALAHLRGSLIGEGDGHDRPGRYAVIDEVRHAVGQRARLAGACARKHQKRPFERFRREPLFPVQIA